MSTFDYGDTPGCFVCGNPQGRNHKVFSAAVLSREAGERVVALFGRGVKVIEFEPQRFRVLVGSCWKHRSNLQLLDPLNLSYGGVINEEMIQDAREGRAPAIPEPEDPPADGKG